MAFVPVHYSVLHAIFPDVGSFGGIVIAVVLLGLIMTPVLLYRGRKRPDGSRSAPRLPILTIGIIAGIFAIIVMWMTITETEGLGFALVGIWAFYTTILMAIGVVVWRIAKIPVSRP